MRNICEVINQMYVHIPGNRDDLIRELSHVKYGSFYTAPESMSMRWKDIAHILYDEFQLPPEQLTGWQRKVTDIFMGVES